GVADLSRGLARGTALCGRRDRRVLRVKIDNYLRRARRQPISTLASEGRLRSGQTGQTVNLLALRLRWFESSPAQLLLNLQASGVELPWAHRLQVYVPAASSGAASDYRAKI